MKKIILLASLLATSLTLKANVCTEVISLSPKQIETLQYSHHRGEPYNLGETLAAISWQESSAGKYLINPRDPSGGAYHVLARTALSYEGIKYNTMNESLILTKLVLNRDYSADMALTVLRTDAKRFNNSRYLMWGSYNGGPTWMKKEEATKNRAKSYALKIRDKVNLLSKCEQYWKK